MRRFEDIGVKAAGALNRRIEIIDLKPQEDTVAVRLLIEIAEVWMIASVPVMKLQDQFAIRQQALVLAAAMSAFAIEQPPIPTAARFDIGNCDERLRTHKRIRIGVRGTPATGARQLLPRCV